MQVQTVPLNKIYPHKTYQDLQYVLANTSYQLIDPGILTTTAVEALLMTAPIIVLRKRDNYHYIAGHRTYVLSSIFFEPAQEVPVTILKGLSPRLINKYIYIDIFLQRLVIGIPTKADIGCLYRSVRSAAPQTLYDLICPVSQKHLARALGCSKNTIFLPPKRTK
nr:hypothetical protein [uncultured Desulfuromonas sp.]